MSPVVSLPRVDVDLDGVALSRHVAASLEEVRVQHRLSQPSLCELTFFAPHGPIPELHRLRVGAAASVNLPELKSLLFAGEVTAIEHGYQAAHGETVRVRCYDKLHRLRKRQPVRAHSELTTAELARELVADLGISVEAEEDGPLSRRLIQYRQSDLSLLVDVSQRYGLFFTLSNGVLRLLTLRGYGPAISLALGKDLLEIQAEVNAEPACRSVVAKGWDATQVQPHESRADNPRSRAGASAEAPPDLFGSTGEHTLADEALSNDDHARAIAQGELDARVAREVTVRGVAEGDPHLLPGVRVNISGLASSFTGRYVLTSVDHLINRRTGFVSEFSTIPPSFDTTRRGTLATWGTITSVDDPDRLGRVRAWLPSLGQVETDWMGVLAAGAGGGKGFAILPDVDDQVLVLFIGGDTSQAVVLGGLYGAHGPGDYGVEGTSVRRYTLGTAGGQKVKLDDVGQCIRLENKGGSYLDLSPEKVFLHSAVDLEIEAPGRSVVIKGNTIDFRRA